MNIYEIFINEPLVFNIVANKGDTFALTFDVVNESDDSDFVFTSHTAKLQVKVNREDSNSILEFNTTDNSIILTTGSLSLQKSATIMNSIESGQYFYDLEITFPDSTIQTWLKGKFVLNQDTTR